MLPPEKQIHWHVSVDLDQISFYDLPKRKGQKEPAHIYQKHNTKNNSKDQQDCTDQSKW